MLPAVQHQSRRHRRKVGRLTTPIRGASKWRSRLDLACFRVHLLQRHDPLMIKPTFALVLALALALARRIAVLLARDVDDGTCLRLLRR